MFIEYITYEDEDFEGYEIFELVDGTGQISLKGDSYETGLLFDGKPIVFHWSDCEGSVAQYLSRGTKCEDYQKSLDMIRDVVNDKQSKLPLSQSLYPLLRLFESGQYLIKETILEEYEYFAYEDSHLIRPEHYYPWNFTLIGTQPKYLLNENTIKKHIETMKNNFNPKIIVASIYDGGGSMFLIDGHHKLEAYQRVNKKPKIIEIVFVTPKELEKKDGISFLNKKSDITLYTKVKEKYFTKYYGKEFRFIVGKTKNLFDAIYRGDIKSVELLIKEDNSLINAHNTNGYTPYHFASSLAQNEILELFLNMGVDIDSKDKNGKAMLHYINKKSIDTIKLLIKRGATIDILTRTTKETPLAIAISCMQFENAKLLLSLGADPKICIQDLILLASHRAGGADMIKTLIKYGLNPTIYHQKEIKTPSVCKVLEEYFLSLERE